MEKGLKSGEDLSGCFRRTAVVEEGEQKGAGVFCKCVVEGKREIQGETKAIAETIEKELVPTLTVFPSMGNCSKRGKCGPASTRKSQWGERLVGRTHVHG